MRTETRWAAIFLALAALAGTAFAEKPPVNASRGVAIEGYDPVAYFDGAARPGEKSITHVWQGATWRFASEENRDRFAADPERWAPRYGGYCAYAVSQGYTAGIDPLAWTVRDGKLYLNYNKEIEKKWLADVGAYTTAADRNWPGVLK